MATNKELKMGDPCYISGRPHVFTVVQYYIRDAKKEMQYVDLVYLNEKTGSFETLKEVRDTAVTRQDTQSVQRAHEEFVAETRAWLANALWESENITAIRHGLSDALNRLDNTVRTAKKE